MDVNEVIQVVNGVGFPIVACGAMFWMYNNTQEKNTGAINDVNIAVTKLIGTLDNLSDMIGTFDKRLRKLEERGSDADTDD